MLFISWYNYFCWLPEVLMEVMHLEQDTDGKIISKTFHFLFTETIGDTVNVWRLFSSYFVSGYISMWNMSMSMWKHLICLDPPHPTLLDNVRKKMKLVLREMFLICARLVAETHFSTLDGEGNLITDAHHDASPHNIWSSSSSSPLWARPYYNVNMLLC